MAASKAWLRRKNAVSQGKREILGDWSGRIRHPPPLSAGIAESARVGLLIPAPGWSERTVPPS